MFNDNFGLENTLPSSLAQARIMTYICCSASKLCTYCGIKVSLFIVIFTFTDYACTIYNMMTTDTSLLSAKLQFKINNCALDPILTKGTVFSTDVCLASLMCQHYEFCIY